MLGVEVLELRHVVVLGTNERRHIRTVLAPRKDAGTTITDDQMCQTTRRRLQEEDSGQSLRPACIFDGVGLIRPSVAVR
jgi:hypothetical protein